VIVTSGVGVGGGAAYAVTTSPLSLLGADLALWLDAKDTTTLFTDTGEGTPSANGAAVGRWKDKSGSARHADQAVAGAKPTRSDSLFGGSRTGLSLDGGDALATPAIDLSGTAAIELWVVAQGTVAGASEVIVEAGNGTGADGAFILYYGAGAVSVGHWAPVNGSDATGDDNSHVYRYTANRAAAAGSEDVIYIDAAASGTPYGSGTTGNFANLAVNIGARNGASLYFAGSIGEIVIAKRALTSGESTALHSYLQAKWGTP
jgi:hypothetical protein